MYVENVSALSKRKTARNVAQLGTVSILKALLTQYEIYNSSFFFLPVRARDAILDLIVERTHDISYYTRCAVLKVWTQLVEVAAVVMRLMHIIFISISLLFFSE